MRAAFCLLVLPLGAFASGFRVDTLRTDTIAAQSSSNGITISSYVYIAAGSSLTLQGSGGYIVSGSSIVGSSFFGDGSQLTGIGHLSSSQVFSGANIFLSSFTVQSGGAQIILSTCSSVNDISISPLGVASFAPELHNSSATVAIPQYATNSRNLGPCVTGSTLTITTSGGRVEAIFTGMVLVEAPSPSGPTTGYLAILQDGNFVGDQSANKGISLFSVDTFSGGQPEFSASYLFDALPAGNHSYCLSLATNDRVTLVQASGSTIDNVTNTFYVKEIK